MWHAWSEPSKQGAGFAPQASEPLRGQRLAQLSSAAFEEDPSRLSEASARTSDPDLGSDYPRPSSLVNRSGRRGNLSRKISIWEVWRVPHASQMAVHSYATAEQSNGNCLRRSRLSFLNTGPGESCLARCDRIARVSLRRKALAGAFRVTFVRLLG